MSAVLLLGVWLGWCAGVNAADRPNIVFILADDLGWSDTTLYGGTAFYQTPHLERLARQGMTFRRAYAASPLCSPTRASILTGQSPARIGITSPVCHEAREDLQASVGATAPASSKTLSCQSASRLSPEYFTLAEALRQAGYATGHFGKWHLGHSGPYEPRDQGFDVDFPHTPAAPGPGGGYLAPWKFITDPEITGEPGQHIEDRTADEVVAFMEQHQDRPFFVNYWQFSVHAPFSAKPDLIEKYRGRVDPQKAQRSPTYAAMVESLDDGVGKVLDAIERLGLADRTIIVFFSDNGGNMYNEIDGTVPTSNAPLRGGKATVFEGGIRVPCVVVWPGHVAAGTRSDAVVQSCDFYPTLLEILQLEPQPGQVFDGISIVPALRGQPLKREAIFTFFPHEPKVPDWLPPSAAVHCGDWKLIRIFHGGEQGAHRWKLFNLHDDPGEETDLAAREPARVQAMDARIEKFLTDTGAVVPRPNPAFDPAVYRPEEEGKPVRPKPALPPVAGWRPQHQCTLALRDGELVITSTGNDPQLLRTFPTPLPAGRYVLDMTLASNAAGTGQFFWQEQGVQPQFFRERRLMFDIRHDAQPQDIHLEFTAANPVPAIRLDPASGAGTIRLSALRITDAAGNEVFLWVPNRG